MINAYTRIPLCALALSLCLSTANGQDIVYSLADYMPTWTNPGLTGAFLGTARVGGLYRDQSRGFNTEAFQTPGAYVDAPILTIGKKKKSWLGIGGTLISDTRGLGQLNSTYISGSAAFHTILNQSRDSRTLLSFGLQGGVIQRSADLSDTRIIIQEEVEVANQGGGLMLGTGMDRNNGNPFDNSGVEIGFGVSLGRDIDEDRSLRVGIAAHHLIPSKVQLSQGGQMGDYEMPLLYSVQGQYRQVLDDAFVLEPALYLQGTRGSFTTQVQSMFGMYFGEGPREERKLISLGLGYRLPQQIYPMVAFESKGLRVAAAFDIYVGGAQGAVGGSSQPDDNGINSSGQLFNSGFELAAQYIIKIYKQPKVDPVILCPQL